MVGADLSGIELRMLSHYLGRYDGGRYAEILLNGDIHQVNADKIGITRTQVKTVTYAFLYGAGDKKIGASVDKSLCDKEATRVGREVRAAFVNAIDGLGELLAAVKHRAASGAVSAIDGRTIRVDSKHKALNYLLQSSAGIIAKRWMCRTYDAFKSNDYPVHQLGFIHDELQYESAPDHAQQVSNVLTSQAVATGCDYSLRVPIAAEARIGETWADTH
jgi:DNA polymerase I-like protein with 3'-5' exonuclease and polymerase domains